MPSVVNEKGRNGRANGYDEGTRLMTFFPTSAFTCSAT